MFKELVYPVAIVNLVLVMQFLFSHMLIFKQCLDTWMLQALIISNLKTKVFFSLSYFDWYDMGLCGVKWRAR